MTASPFLTVTQGTAAYPVYIGAGLLGALGSILHPRGRAFLITSRALAERFESVCDFGTLSPHLLEMPEGEERKSMATVEALLDALLAAGARRDSTVIALGGGMIGDTAGFAASILLRGVDLIHIPTTLLAQVDSSIGGKVAVNHPRGKNLIGSFHAPRLVISDTGVLTSLSPRELRSGLFEALKSGVIGDPDLFDRFAQGEQPALDETVRRSVRVKAEIVSRDEKEADLRRLLNYGHTIGHGIEVASGFALTHGDSVGWGMIAANSIAVRRGLLGPRDAQSIDDAVVRLGPAELPQLDVDEIFALTEQDKKNSAAQRVMVLPRRVGECVVVSDISEAEVRFGIETALERSAAGAGRTGTGKQTDQ